MKVGDLVKVRLLNVFAAPIIQEGRTEDIGIYLGVYFSPHYNEELSRVLVDGVVMQYFDECVIEVISESR